MHRKTFLLYTGSLLGFPALIAQSSCKHQLPEPQPAPQPQWLMQVDLNLFLNNINDYVQDAARGIYVKRVAAANNPGSFTCFSLECTHSGCIVALQSNGEFHCPCHGSKFNADGTVLAGPAARGMDRFKVSIEGNILKVSR